MATSGWDCRNGTSKGGLHPRPEYAGKLNFYLSGGCSVTNRIRCVGARLKVQAKAKFDQISEGPIPREGVIQDMRLEVWSRFTEGATTELGCYGLAPVLKVSDDKIDYNRPISCLSAALKCSKLLI